MGVTDITVIAGYRAESITTQNFQMIINPEFASSNMVHTLFCGRDLMVDDSDLIIAYGDIVYEPKVLRALLDSDAPLSVVVDREWRRFWELRMPDPLSDAETMKIDGQGMITELGKTPGGYEEIQGQYIGLIKVRRNNVVGLRQLYDAMDPDGPYDGKTRKQMYMTSFIQHAIDSGWPAGAVLIANGWLEVDTYAELELYRRMEAEGTLAEFMRL
jgi:choline kinase